MITIRNIIKNLSTGQSSIRVKSIIKDLEQFYQSIKPKIQILHARKELDGTSIYFRIPSENEPKLIYDIVIWFNSQDEITLETEVKIYSNSPGFAFNFAYLFNSKNSLLFPSNYPDIFRSNPPKVRNPLDTISFDKHVYAALRSIIRRNLKNVLIELQETHRPIVATFEQKQTEIEKLRELKKKFMKKSGTK